MSPSRVYIGLGSNLNDPSLQLKKACHALSQLVSPDSFQCSPVYQSAPFGGLKQPDYLNAVVSFKTTLPAFKLLDTLLLIEKQQGRIRTEEQWAARPLDLDLLLYGEKTLHTNTLTLPHPRMKERATVLKPLHDLNPVLTLPCGNTLSDLLERVDLASLTKKGSLIEST